MKIDEKPHNRVSSISNQFPILIDWYRFWSIGEFIDCVRRAWHECNEIIIWLLYIYEIIVICDILSNKRILYQLKVDLDKLNQIDQSEINTGQMQAKFEQLIFFLDQTWTFDPNLPVRVFTQHPLGISWRIKHGVFLIFSSQCSMVCLCRYTLFLLATESKDCKR